MSTSGPHLPPLSVPEPNHGPLRLEAFKGLPQEKVPFFVHHSDRRPLPRENYILFVIDMTFPDAFSKPELRSFFRSEFERFSQYAGAKTCLFKTANIMQNAYFLSAIMDFPPVIGSSKHITL
jgi:hypothetical protein